MNKEHIESVKNVWDILQSIATIVAIIVGGVWTYKNFVVERENHPRLELALAASDFQVSPACKLLIVDENLSNLGTRLIKLRAGEIRVIQVLPLPDGPKGALRASKPLPAIDDPNAWPVLNQPAQSWGENDHVIEPGEADQIHSQMLLPENIQMVEILAYVYNPTGNPKKPLGWRVTRLYDLRTHTLMPLQSSPPAKAGE